MIVVGVSGGVDSSVAALLLKQQGHDVRGCFMNNWPTNDPACRGEADRIDALRVCGMLNIPFVARNFSKQYQQDVFAHFLSEYSRGRTPNPDILCNREIKFKVFLQDALASGASKIATGHYARKEIVNGRSLLLRAKDPSKDQSYFLHAITHEALSYAEFPLGHLLKSTVRDLAQDAGLLTAHKQDSTGICFIEPGHFRSFLASHLPAQQGDMIDETGRVLGRHDGALYYTLGQRAPLGGVKGGTGEGWFVADKRVSDNTLVLVQGSNHPKLFAKSFATETVSWIAGSAPSSDFNCQVQIRHLGSAYPALVSIDQDNCAHVQLDQSVRAVAPGQSAVFYLDDVCLGGGVICKTDSLNN